MNCHECRKHLNPFLDNELDVSQNLAILEHRNACAACDEIFSSEERSWEMLRNRLQQERLPETARSAVLQELDAMDRSSTRRRILVAAMALAATLLVALLIVGADDLRQMIRPTEVAPVAHDHGAAVTFAVNDFRAITRTAEERGSRVLASEFLETLDFQVLKGEQIWEALGEVFGSRSRVPESLRERCATGARRSVAFKGVQIRQVLFNDGDAEVSVYVMPVRLAELVGLAGIPSDSPRNVRIAACSRCRIAAVTRDDLVYLMVTREPYAERLVSLATKF